MAFSGYLAMTAAEMHNCSAMPKKMAYMACHFSPYGLGLSNLPEHLPADSILMVNDRTPIHRHDPMQIAQELTRAVEKWQCFGIILDFQRPDSPEATAVAKTVVEALPCPVCVTPAYAEGLACPMLLPPIPPDTAVDIYLKPYLGRELWLEVAQSAQIITVTPDGAQVRPLPPGKTPTDGHRDDRLCCHYQIKADQNAAVFTLYRTPDDLQALMEKARTLGVTCFAGLYQEVGEYTH